MQQESDAYTAAGTFPEHSEASGSEPAAGRTYEGHSAAESRAFVQSHELPCFLIQILLPRDCPAIFLQGITQDILRKVY